jgi:hypothetical protein
VNSYPQCTRTSGEGNGTNVPLWRICTLLCFAGSSRIAPQAACKLFFYISLTELPGNLGLCLGAQTSISELTISGKKKVEVTVIPRRLLSLQAVQILTAIEVARKYPCGSRAHRRRPDAQEGSSTSTSRPLRAGRTRRMTSLAHNFSLSSTSEPSSKLHTAQK